MGDVRYDAPLRAVKEANDRLQALRALTDEDVIAALAASAKDSNPYLANVLATEAQNRIFRMRAITDSMSEGVIVAAVDGRIVHVNPAAERMFRLDREAFFSGKAEALLHLDADSFRRYQRALEEEYQARGAARIEVEMRRADGTHLWTDQALTALRNAAGEEAGWVFVIRDVTEARELRDRLSRANALHEAVFSSVSALALILDPDLRIVRANPAFTQHMGVSEASLVGRPLAEVMVIYPENEDAMRAVLATGRAYQGLGEPDPAGQHLWDWGAFPLRDPGGRIDGLLLTAVDTTHRREAHKGFVDGHD